MPQLVTSVISDLPVDRDWSGIVLFARHLIGSRDQDPIYPVLRELSEIRGHDHETALWQAVLYQAFYHLPSAIEAFNRLGSFKNLTLGRLERAHLEKLPTGIERRGLRGGMILAYLDALCEIVPERRFEPWITNGWGKDPIENYHRFRFAWQSIPYNGRWSSFKMAEILKVAYDYYLAAPDMDMENATGPREGLEFLYGLRRVPLKEINLKAEEFRHRLEVNLRFSLDWETVETVLCNWNSVRLGRYYVGHDIDELQEQIVRAQFSGHLAGADAEDLWTARRRALPEWTLGELWDRHGVAKDLQVAWRDHHEIVRLPPKPGLSSA